VTLHLLRLNQDIVAWSQEEKCGLKYVIHIPKARKMKKGGAKTPPFLYEKDSWGNSSILDPYS
jgi:hypothetical protein